MTETTTPSAAQGSAPMPACAWAIDPREIERHTARRGRPHAFTRIDPAHTALVIVDLVRFYDSDTTRATVPHIQPLATTLRAAGGTVAWVVPAPGEASPKREEFYGAATATMFQASGGDGPIAQRLMPGLIPLVADSDLLVEKTAHSAFFPGRCPLDGLLRERGIDTLLVCGTVTSVCVESTIRDAATLGYRVIAAGDACADGNTMAHNATLRVVYRTFGDVRSTPDLLGLIAAGSNG